MVNTVRRAALLSAVLLLALSTQAYALTGVTKDGYMFCMSEGFLEDLTSFMADNDDENIRDYVDDKSCAYLKGGLIVTIVKSSGFFDTRVELEYKGVRIWTFREAIKIDKSTKK